MEQQQLEAIDQLLTTTETKQVEEQRIYISSKTYGDSRFHIISKLDNGIQIDQTNIDEKWGSRVFIQNDELPALIKTLLCWYLDTEEWEYTDDLGDLEAHPF